MPFLQHRITSPHSVLAAGVPTPRCASVGAEPDPARSVEGFPDEAIRDSYRKGLQRRTILAHVSKDFHTLGSTVGIERGAPGTDFTGFQVKLAFVPSADDDIVLIDLAVLERKADVRASIVHRVNRPGCADQKQVEIIALDNSSLAHRQYGLGQHAQPIEASLMQSCPVRLPLSRDFGQRLGVDARDLVQRDAIAGPTQFDAIAVLDGGRLLHALIKILEDEQPRSRLLVRPFGAVRDIDGIANGGKLFALLRTDGTDNCLAIVDADASVEMPAIHGVHVRLGSVDRGQHLQCRLDRPQRRQRIVVDAEKGHDFVADEVIDVALVALDDLSHLVEIPIHDEHYIVGRKRLGKRREITEVTEQDGDCLVFQTAPEPVLGKLSSDLDIGRVPNKPAHFHVAAQTRLARKADLRPKS